MIAAPFYLANLHEPIGDEITPEQRERTSGALAGLHEFHAGSEFWFYPPVVPGDRASSARWVSSVTQKESSFGGGKGSVVRALDEFIEADDGAPLLKHRSTFIHTEREGAKKAAKEQQEPPFYTPEQIEQIEADILAETTRGRAPRY